MSDSINRQEAIKEVENADILVIYDSTQTADVIASSVMEQTRNYIVRMLQEFPSAESVEIEKVADMMQWLLQDGTTITLPDGIVITIARDNSE